MNMMRRHREFEPGGDGRIEIRSDSRDGAVELRVAGGEFPERRMTLSRTLARELGVLLVRITEPRH